MILYIVCRRRLPKNLMNGLKPRVNWCHTHSKKKVKFSDKYSASVLLPKSQFLVKHSRSLETNYDISLPMFEKLADKSAPKGPFVLHDGPPYANGSLHFGHAINKFLKDMICRRKVLEGFDVCYVPGWDCHGLPIELKALANDLNISNPIEIREKAKQLALNVIEEHKQCFKSWQIIGDWDNPYLTFDSKYIRNELQSFETLINNGLVYRSHSPVYWSPTGRTALAEAELQYNETHVSKSVFVKFKLTTIPLSLQKFSDLSALIWTTTPWTLPANQAIAYSTDLDYCVVTINRFSDEYLLVAKDLISSLEKTLDSKIDIKEVIKGHDLKGTAYSNPIALNHEILPFLESAFVTTTKGTGLVHTAPNHGLDDYKVIIANGIPLKDSIVDEKGCFVSTSNSALDNKSVMSDGNDMIIDLLADSLLYKHNYIHSYPYDWRFNEPVIVRASPQWFLNIESIREDCIKTLENVTFYPDFYKDYLINQLKVRPNWCISRQRSWGVPIPVFYHKDDTEYKTPIFSNTILNHILDVFEEKGCDVWWLSPIDQLVPKHIIENELKMSCNELMKGKDIFDIWFDSGNSWKTALSEPKVADMYLEGYDQLRGWFQSSLILSVALRKCPPFKSIKIHGFALDTNGKKMSKSIGNVIDPNQVILNTNKATNCGSDGFRWWTAKYASDHKDERVSIDSFDETLVSINDIRRIIRFLMGSIHDFDSSKHMCHLSDMNILDKYLLHYLHYYLNDMQLSYSNHRFSRIISSSLEFVVKKVSRFYFSRVKHRLFCHHKTSPGRRNCQTVLFYLYNSIVHQLAPILPHIMTEAYTQFPISSEFIQNMKDWDQPDIEEDMKLVLSMTDLINKEMFGKNMSKYDCFINIDSNGLQNLKLFQMDSQSMDSDLCEILGTSLVTYSDTKGPQKDGITLKGYDNHINYELVITSANNYLCDRCRRYTATHRSQACNECLKVLSLS